MALGGNYVTTVSASAIDIAANDNALQPDGTLKKRYRLLPMGKFELRGHGKTCVMTPSLALTVIANSKALLGAQEIPVDYDHQAEEALKQKGATAIASGWIAPSSLAVEADGIYGEIHFTKAATEKILAKEYRYFSPVIGLTKTNQIVAIVRGGLTNSPSIDNLTEIAAGQLNQEDKMDLTALAALFSLGADATLEQITAAAKKQGENLLAASAVIATFQTAFGVKENASAEEIVAASAAIKSAKPAGEGDVIVSASAIAEMQAEINASRETRLAASIDTAIAAGKITPAQREVYIGMMRKDEAGVSALIASSLPVLNNKAQIEGQAKTGESGLTEVQILAASIAGVSHADYLETLKSEGAV